ncbi:hypothetical protein [Deinococcus sp. NW-56]|uniref:hypothetical protein n=1 Tax=Deinococcus sp. NW-56 TaxID=2080419 RepID=UPI000CF49F4D|nr:hypothetical protein [Deinococcus sp. NW-56]
MTEDASRVEFIELIFPITDDFNLKDCDGIEEALQSALSAWAMGHVSGVGVGMGVFELSIEIDEHARHEPQRVITAVLEVVRSFRFPAGSYLLVYPTSLQPVEL